MCDTLFVRQTMHLQLRERCLVVSLQPEQVIKLRKQLLLSKAVPTRRNIHRCRALGEKELICAAP